MIHDAASRLRCTHVQASCYQPTTPHSPRPCPAREKGQSGCACDIAAKPHRATPRPVTSGTRLPSRAAKRFGYRSLAFQLCDPRWRVHWVLLSAFQPANEHEEGPAAELLRTIPQHYPWLHLYAVAGDAGLGYDSFLNAIYELQARRVVDLHIPPIATKAYGLSVAMTTKAAPSALSVIPCAPTAMMTSFTATNGLVSTLASKEANRHSF